MALQLKCFGALSLVSLALGGVVACSDDDDATAGPDGGGSGGSTADAGSGGASGSGGSDAGSGGASASGGSDASAGGAETDASAGGTDGGGGDSGADSGDAGPTKVFLDLTDVKASPESYDFFDFRPNIRKLILAGDAASEHVAVLHYTTVDGSVALHYHAKTESVYVIDGTQTDAKGTYSTGTVYYNPPGSGHAITNSSGYFLLAYAAPPDFVGTDKIEAYTPVKIDTTAADLLTTYAFEEKAAGVKVYAPELVSAGGMTASIVETTSVTAYALSATYVLVLGGECVIDGSPYGKDKLAVGTSTAPQGYTLASTGTGKCLALTASF